MKISFYSRTEAATILQVTVNTISKYIREGILKNYGTPRNIKLDYNEVHSFYDTVKSRRKEVDMSDHLKLVQRTAVLESELEVLKKIVGVGTLKPARSDEELQLLHRGLMAMLTKNTWDTMEMIYVSDVMLGLRDREVLRLVQIKGTRIWTCVLDLSERMLHYLKGLALPKQSIEIIETRLEGGRNRMYGLLYVSISEHIAMDKFWAKKIISSRAIEKTTDEWLIDWLAKRGMD